MSVIHSRPTYPLTAIGPKTECPVEPGAVHESIPIRCSRCGVLRSLHPCVAEHLLRSMGCFVCQGCGS